MKLKPDTYFLVFLVAIAIVFVVHSFTFARLEAKLVAIMIGSVVLILGGIQLFREIKDAAITEETEEKEIGISGHRVGLLAAWVGGFFVITYLFGFLISVPLFIISYLKIQGTNWLPTVTAAAATIMFIYGFFELFLLRILWRGIMPFL